MPADEVTPAMRGEVMSEPFNAYAYGSYGAQLLRESLAPKPHVWCAEFGWHDATLLHSEGGE